MTNSVDKSLEELIAQSMKNAFSVQEEEIVDELTEDEKRKQEIAKAIAEAQEARRIAAEKEKDLEEVVKYKSEKATTSDEKDKEIVEKNVKNKIEINPEMKESIVGKIYQMYNNKYLSEKQYTLTNADKAGNTKAWQDRDKKNVKTGEPLYKKADHMKEHHQKDENGNVIEHEEEEAQKKTLTIEESDKLYLLKANGDVAYEVTDLIMPDPLHELNRYAKETGKNTGALNKRPGSKVKKKGDVDDKALMFVRGMIRKETGKPEGQQKKVKGDKSRRQVGDRRESPKSTITKAREAKKRADAAMMDTRGT